MTQPEEKQAELTEHLAELRTRIIRSLVYLTVGTIACWFLYDKIYDILMGPIAAALKGDVKPMLTGLTEAFMLRMQVCIVSGLIVTIPLVTMELWGFVSPALTRDEKKPLRWIAPMSVALFAMGVGLCYFILPIGVRWFVSYVPKNAELRPVISQNMLFVVKMLLAFGAAFELPVVLMLLGKLGIVNSKLLKAYWRQAVLVLAIVAAVVTPSSDAFSMMMMAVPLCFLYMLSIVLVRFVEPRK